ncbi:uncharacterized protein LOC142559680 [Dermacentor variabilis]|uniref:uncharacterized protein LOC142559680 n=1 Tax=Dermacentor variabilis TaxID=34621 RepID=UPI003F5B5640
MQAVDSVDDIENHLKLCKASTPRQIPLAVSVTLKARWFKSNGSNVGLFERCDNVTKVVDVHPYSVCSSGVSGEYRYDPKHMSGIFANGTHGLTVETEQSIKAKMCALRADNLDTNYGIAVYDIDADMDDGACEKVEYTGQYKRLKLLRKINEFMKAYTKKSLRSMCEQL